MPLSKITNPFLDPAGSVNSNVYSPAANTLVMTSAGVEKLRATSTGIGIGGLTPGAALDVNTNIYITETSASSSNTQLTMFSKFSDGQRGYTILKTESNSSGSSDLVVRSRHSFSEAEKFRIDSVGRVTTPSQPSAALGRNTDFTTTASTILWDVVHHNVGSHYNSSTGLFTCPVAGYYLVSIMVMSAGTNAIMDVELRLNGSTNNSLVPYQSATGGDYNQVSGMTVISCAANDTLGLRLSNGSIYGGGSTGRHGAVVFRLLG